MSYPGPMATARAVVVKVAHSTGAHGPRHRRLYRQDQPVRRMGNRPVGRVGPTLAARMVGER